jgi:hypothetical protein
MPDLREVFQMSTQKIRPDGGFVERQEFRQRRRTRNRRIAAYAIVAVIVALAVFAITEVRNTASVPAVPPPSTGDLGIFAPVAGRILYVNGDSNHVVGADDLNYGPGLWAAAPNGPSDTTEGPRVTDDVASTLVRLDLGEADSTRFLVHVPLLFGWSSDGTELLFTPGRFGKPFYILHADGSRTRLNADPMVNPYGAISPDGSRVVFGNLDIVDVDGGSPVHLPYEGPEPAGTMTFSPDGTQIAYLVDDAVWVVNADGTDAHELLANEATRNLSGYYGLQWSPTGDRLAIDLGDGIYTFAPDGSDFTKVIADGSSPFWSPDGSQIAYNGPSGLTIADADGSNARAFGFAVSGPWHPGESSEVVSPTILAKGEDVELVGEAGLGAQTVNVNAEELNGEATGEFRVADNVIRVDCVDTDTDGVVILAGEATGGSDVAVGDLLALIIREGDPDSVALLANDSGAASCTGLLKAIPDHSLTDDSNFVDVEDGYDIQTS